MFLYKDRTIRKQNKTTTTANSDKPRKTSFKYGFYSEEHVAFPATASL